MANSGPLYLDCRNVAPGVALRRMENALKKARAGARMVVLRTDERDVLELILEWADAGCARYSIVESHDTGMLDLEIRIFLLPHDFGAHPFLAWRPSLPHDPAATPPLF